MSMEYGILKKELIVGTYLRRTGCNRTDAWRHGWLWACVHSECFIFIWWVKMRSIAIIVATFKIQMHLINCSAWECVRLKRQKKEIHLYLEMFDLCLTNFVSIMTVDMAVDWYSIKFSQKMCPDCSHHFHQVMMTSHLCWMTLRRLFALKFPNNCCAFHNGFFGGFSFMHMAYTYVTSQLI